MTGNLLEFRVYELLLGAVEDFTLSLPPAEFPNGIRTAIPNKELPSQEELYLKVNHVPASPIGPCLEDTREFRGVCLVNIIAKRNSGLRKAVRLGSYIVDHFHQGLNIFDEDIDPPLKLKIDRQTNIRPVLYEDDEVMIPVLINYRSFY